MPKTYARQGFWQLLVVTVLTLVVIAVAVRMAPRTTPGDLLVVRLLLALLCLLALAVVASALHRMSLYEQEYGFTRLRVFVDAVELTLRAAFVLLLAAGIRLTGAWLARETVALAAGALLALATVNPDAYIARHNVNRYEKTGRIDLAYIASLPPTLSPHSTAYPPHSAAVPCNAWLVTSPRLRTPGTTSTSPVSERATWCRPIRSRPARRAGRNCSRRLRGVAEGGRLPVRPDR